MIPGQAKARTIRMSSGADPVSVVSLAGSAGLGSTDFLALVAEQGRPAATCGDGVVSLAMAFVVRQTVSSARAA